MSRACRAVPAAVLAVLLLPGVAAAGPDVPDQNLQVSVKDLRLGQSVTDLDLARSIVPLEEEKTTGGTVVVRIASDVLFEFGEATLTGTARTRIGRLTGRFRGTTGTVRVVGFTDDIGTPAANLRLSKQRAEAVKAEIQRQLGGAGVSILAGGRGEAAPVAPNTEDGKDNPAGRAQNRRVEITFNKG